MFTSDELVEKLNISRSTLWRWCRDGKIPHYRLPGEKLRFDEEEIKNWLEERKTVPA